MSFCPNCGKEIKENSKFCEACGYKITDKKENNNQDKPQPIGDDQKTDAINALKKGFDLISTKPMVLLPAFIGAIVSTVLSLIAQRLFLPVGSGLWFLDFTGANWIGLLLTGVVLVIIGGIISYIMAFASLDMSRDAYLNQELNLSQSISYVFSRFFTFIVASIVGAIFAITIILIPVVILMFVIMVLDEAGISISISKAFQVLGDKLGDIIILIIISIIATVILGLIPYIGSILTAGFNVLVALAYIDIYYNYKKLKTN